MCQCYHPPSAEADLAHVRVQHFSGSSNRSRSRSDTRHRRMKLDRFGTPWTISELLAHLQDASDQWQGLVPRISRCRLHSCRAIPLTTHLRQLALSWSFFIGYSMLFSIHYSKHSGTCQWAHGQRANTEYRTWAGRTAHKPLARSLHLRDNGHSDLAA